MITFQCGHGDVAVEDAALESRLQTRSLRFQCGHGDVAVEDFSPRRESLPDGHASMWPRRCRRGRPDRKAVDRKRPFGFNVATAMSPWKTSTSESDAIVPEHFNVATAMSPWKTQRSRSPRYSSRWLLQCGHGDVAVEDLDGSRGEDVEVHASMWPRRCRRGRHNGLARAFRSTSASMWPRRCRRGRLLLFSLLSSRYTWLQCGHGDVAVEDAIATANTNPATAGFNVATAMSPWKTW